MLVGSYCTLSNQGGLVHPKTSVEDQDELSSLLQVPLVVSMHNYCEMLKYQGEKRVTCRLLCSKSTPVKWVELPSRLCCPRSLVTPLTCSVYCFELLCPNPPVPHCIRFYLPHPSHPLCHIATLCPSAPPSGVRGWGIWSRG